MQNPSSIIRGALAKNTEPDAESILAPKAPKTQAPEARSPHSSPQNQPERSLVSYPSLPSHLNQLIDQPWNRENSLKLDQWHWYCQQEFEEVGGWQ